MKKRRWFVRIGTTMMVVLSCSGCLTGSNSQGAAPAVAREASGPGVTITSPAAEEIDTIDESIDLEGSVDAGTEISSVAWENNAGGSGQASGTLAWQAVDIPLALGVNTITVRAVRATDTENTVAADTIVVNRESEFPGSATLSWDAPTERADGTPLTDLAGYRIYYGRMSEIYDYEVELDNAGLSTFTVQNLLPGEWFFSVTAYDAEGNESKASNEAATRVL